MFSTILILWNQRLNVVSSSDNPSRRREVMKGRWERSDSDDVTDTSNKPRVATPPPALLVCLHGDEQTMAGDGDADRRWGFHPITSENFCLESDVFCGGREGQ